MANGSLETFFDTWGSLLRGDISASDVEAALGPSASGTDAIAYCQRLYHHHREQTLRQLFPAVAALVDDWPALVAAYATVHPATGTAHRAWGVAFPAFLAGWSGLPESERAPLAELAVLAEARRCARFAEDEADRVRLVATRFAVLAADRAFREGSASLPVAGAEVFVVYRGVDREAVRELRLDAAGLVALLRARSAVVPAGLADVDDHEASRWLREKGVLR